MAEWYWMKDGQKCGPVDTAHLKQLARTGQLQPTDVIWREGMPNGVPASQAKGLEFGATRSAPTGESDAAAFSAPESPGAAQRLATVRGAIKYRCAHCGGVLESEGRFGGKQDTCPMCGKATPVPLASTMGAGAFFRKIPKAVYIGTAAVVLIAVVSLSAWLALRDTWERDHAQRVQALSETVVALEQQRKYEQAVEKHRELQILLGDRQLRDMDLKSVVHSALKSNQVARQFLRQARSSSLSITGNSLSKLEDQIRSGTRSWLQNLNALALVKSRPRDLDPFDKSDKNAALMSWRHFHLLYGFSHCEDVFLRPAFTFDLLQPARSVRLASPVIDAGTSMSFGYRPILTECTFDEYNRPTSYRGYTIDSKTTTSTQVDSYAILTGRGSHSKEVITYHYFTDLPTERLLFYDRVGNLCRETLIEPAFAAGRKEAEVRKDRVIVHIPENASSSVTWPEPVAYSQERDLWMYAPDGQPKEKLTFDYKGQLVRRLLFSYRRGPIGTNTEELEKLHGKDVRRRTFTWHDDDGHRVLRVTEWNASKSGKETRSYRYGEDGRLVGLIRPDSGRMYGCERILFAYGQPTGDGRSDMEVCFDTERRVFCMRFPGAAAGPGTTFTFEYDHKGRVAGIRTKGRRHRRMRFTYVDDARGNWIERTAQVMGENLGRAEWEDLNGKFNVKRTIEYPGGH